MRDDFAERLTERSKRALAETPCPQCARQGLQITAAIKLKPVGTHSLAGAQLKFAGDAVPVLSCTHCDWSREGVQIGSDMYFDT